MNTKMHAKIDFDMRYGNSVFGVDEVGLGPLMGPIVSVCVIWKCYPQIFSFKIDDSKKLTALQREKTYAVLQEMQGVNLDWGVGIVEIDFINQNGLRKSVDYAMSQAISLCPGKPDSILIDGVRSFDASMICVPKGDAISLAIGTASIIAKVIRDRMVDNLDLEFPEYHWKSNKGYGTKDHLEVLRAHGVTKYHRVFYKPVAYEINRNNFRK